MPDFYWYSSVLHTATKSIYKYRTIEASLDCNYAFLIASVSMEKCNHNQNLVQLNKNCKSISLCVELVKRKPLFIVGIPGNWFWFVSEFFGRRKKYVS